MDKLSVSDILMLGFIAYSVLFTAYFIGIHLTRWIIDIFWKSLPMSKEVNALLDKCPLKPSPDGMITTSLTGVGFIVVIKQWGSEYKKEGED